MSILVIGGLLAAFVMFCLFLLTRGLHKRFLLCKELEIRHPEVWRTLDCRLEMKPGWDRLPDNGYIMRRYCMEREYLKLNDPEIAKIGEQCRRGYIRMYWFFGLSGFFALFSWLAAIVT